MNAEFDYLTELSKDFFSQRRTQKSLSLINQYSISGWEIWFQVELSHFLSIHESEPEWQREVSLDYDHRIEKEKQFFRLDFLIRKKGWKKDSFFALDLKQHPKAEICIPNMTKDIDKIEKLRQSSIDLRAHWVLGVFLKESKADINELIARALDSRDYKYEQDHVINRVIPNSPYGYCIF